ncbi:MAG: single-stranded-DNA-specific exonuclease RecJ [Lentisphaeria bacterium]|nr:single-stranded-DNA-specific exonuclease RecJ [Lentisphaeria bacterium]MBR4884810.1 single-stranded-DNA-specific exonuclease RecJ [Lentisphaeria bacterium]
MDSKLWKCASDGKEHIAEQLIRTKSLPNAVALYLAAKGIEPKDVDMYFNATFSDLSDPFRFPGIDLAVERLWKAIRDREQILIHGDYDTDGITATALLAWVLEKNGGIVSSFLPHRFDDGYGFTPDSLQKALDGCGGSCGVLVTVDCGINSAEAVATARAKNIDVIITDHHDPAEDLPDAIAIINPKVHTEVADLRNLSGVGVAFKLAHAFVLYGCAHNEGDLHDVLDYVALGTIADIVPILGENRILVKYGMEILKKQIRPGVRALIEVARVPAKLQPSDITFKLAPRINAAGRLGNAITALQLMTAKNIVDAYRYADMLEGFNQKRQTKEQEIFNEAKRQVESDPNFSSSMTILAAGDAWHQGVIGIVASRFARDYNRPAIVLTIQGDEAHGSGRSIGGLNMIQILSKCSHLLTRFGGHPMAVGLGLHKDKIAEFQKEFEAHVREELQPKDLISSVSYDGLVNIGDLEDEFFQYYEYLGPFGHSNAHPVFRLNQVEVVRTYPIKPGHTKGLMRDIYGNTCDFIAFNMTIEPRVKWDVVATPQINEYYGEKRRQLQIVDFRPSNPYE